MNIETFQQRKNHHSKISMITCYDYWSAKIIATTPIDCILVGDSAAMVMHGFKSTVPADVTMLVAHVQAVARGAHPKFIIADMPFCSYRKGLIQAVEAAQQFIQAGAQAIKLEGAAGNLDLISHLVESGIPVMGHLGLIPQSIHVLGGFKVQAKDPKQITRLKTQAQQLQQAGCFSLVLECVPAEVAKDITESLTIPTIGIGAGPYTDGQVLVLQDILGVDPQFKPKFVKQYCDGFKIIQQALNEFHQEVSGEVFPRVPDHSF